MDRMKEADLGIPGAVAVDFFNHLNMLYGTVTEFCTQQEVSTTTLVPSLFRGTTSCMVQEAETCGSGFVLAAE